ncbi:hypothetical protein [Methylobacterium sp. JK268]
MSWPRRILALVLFLAIMEAIALVLRRTVPGTIGWLDATFGGSVVTGAMIALWVAGLVYVLRDSARRRRAGRSQG